MKFLQNFRSICLKLAHSKCRGEKDSLVNMDLGGHIFLNFLKIEIALVSLKTLHISCLPNFHFYYIQYCIASS